MEKVYEGTIIKESLKNASILDDLRIISEWQDEDWHLYKVEVGEEYFERLSSALLDGPWYMHFWNGNDIAVVFKSRVFHIKANDRTTWSLAVEYGKSLGIPESQLDFLIE